MRSMIPIGIVFRSVDADTPLADEPLTQRTPSTRTSTRLEPRKRRSASVAPAPMPPPSGGYPKLPLELYLLLIAPPETGSCCRMSPTDDGPVPPMSARDIMNTGACLPSGSLMRHPVSTMTSVPTGGASSATAAPGAGVGDGVAGTSTPAAGVVSVAGAGTSGASEEAGASAGASGGSGGAGGDGGDGGGTAGCACAAVGAGGEAVGCACAAVGAGGVCGGGVAWASRRGPGRIRSVGSALAAPLAVTSSAVSPV